VLPPVAGFDTQSQCPRYINNQGMIAGQAGIIGSATRAAVWSPSGAGYTAQRLQRGALGCVRSDVSNRGDRGAHARA
jgi:hypothetical protein